MFDYVPFEETRPVWYLDRVSSGGWRVWRGSEGYDRCVLPPCSLEDVSATLDVLIPKGHRVYSLAVTFA